MLHVLLAAPAWSQTDTQNAKAPPADPTGSWTWDYTFNDNTAEFFLKLNWDGKTLTGKYTAFDNTTEIEETKLDKDQLAFIARREFNDNEFVVRFEGEVEPDDIVGTVAVDFGNGPREFDWHAERIVEIDDVLGTWKLKLDTPNGVVEPQLTITKDGEKLHGAYVSPFGERDAHDVQLKDNELSWRIMADDDDDIDFEIVYRGKPRGNTISGKNEYDFGGDTGEMEFTGRRLPDDKKPAAAAEPAATGEAAAPAADSAPAEADSESADAAEAVAE